MKLCTAPPSGQNQQGVSRHVPKLEGKRPVEEHDEHTVDPLKDGRGMLEDEAFLAEEYSTERSGGQGQLHKVYLLILRFSFGIKKKGIIIDVYFLIN